MMLAGANDQQQNAAAKPLAPVQAPVAAAVGWGSWYFLLAGTALLYVTLTYLGKQADRRA
jgi:hypothetical protein